MFESKISWRTEKLQVNEVKRHDHRASVRLSHCEPSVHRIYVAYMKKSIKNVYLSICPTILSRFQSVPFLLIDNGA